MATSTDSTPISELIAGLISDVTGLLRKEIDLAKTEAASKIHDALGGVEFLIIGAVFAIGAIGVLLSAAVSALATFFVSEGMAPTSADGLAALIVGVVTAGISWALITKGITTLRGTNLTLDRTTASLRRDVDVVKEKM